MVEIVSVYKLYDKPSFDIDDRVDVKYLIMVAQIRMSLKMH